MRTAISIVSGVILLAIGFFAFKSLSNREKQTRTQPDKIIQTVFVNEVRNQKTPIVIRESGRLAAKNKIEIFAEVQGVMEANGREFKPGVKYRKGETIVKIRSNDYTANLQAQKSNLINLITSILPDLRLDYPEAFQKWDTYVRNFDMDKPVPELPEAETDKEKFFITGRNIYSTYYNTKNMEITLSKYNLRAPFSGILTDAVVTPGTLVRQGQKLGEFIDPSVYELEVAVSKSHMSSLDIGKHVEVRDAENPGTTWDGTIVRINGRVDPNTQTVQVFIQVKGEGLREGMYLEAAMTGEEIDNSFEVNRNLLINERELYVVRDSVLTLAEIEPLFFYQKTAVVKGLKDGEVLVTRQVPGGYPGMKVQVSNSEQ